MCGETIEEGSGFDPCGVVIYSRINSDDDEYPEQMFFCHYECFKKSLDPEAREYLNFEDQV